MTAVGQLGTRTRGAALVAITACALARLTRTPRGYR